MRPDFREGTIYSRVSVFKWWLGGSQLLPPTLWIPPLILFFLPALQVSWVSQPSSLSYRIRGPPWTIDNTRSGNPPAKWVVA